MEKREWNDLLKLFAAGTVVTCGLVAVTWFLDEGVHLPARWRLFVLIHISVFGLVLWYIRAVLKQIKPLLVVLAWIIGHISIAFELVNRRVPILLIFGVLPFEVFVIVIVAKFLGTPGTREGSEHQGRL